MINKLMKIALCGCFALMSGWASAANGNQAYVFGDSLSDPGNYFALFGEMSIQPFEVDNVPSKPYALGGQHFTNGPTWVETLTRSLGAVTSGKPAMRVPGVFGNYAVGRSRARDALLDDVFSEVTLTDQVNQFLVDVDNQAPDDALYILWIGANDLADALSAVDPNAILGAALTNTFAQIQRLYLAGARKFLIVNMPNLAVTPRVLDLVSGIPEPFKQAVLDSITMASVGYNMALDGNLSLFQTLLPGLEVTMLDVYSLVNDIVADPESFGLDVIDEACIVPDSLGDVFCNKPRNYLFWDGQHPTKTVHSIIAEEAEAALQGL